MSNDTNVPTQEQAQAAADAISNANKHKIVFALGPTVGDAMEKAGYDLSNPSSLAYTLNQAVGSAKTHAPALAFTENPAPSDNYLGLYKAKHFGIPDDVLKQVRMTSEVVAACLRVRSNILSLFGHLRKDRFDIGIEVEIKPDFYAILTPEQFDKIKQRIKRFEQLLLNCGHTEGLENQDKMTLAEFFSLQAENGLTYGRFGVECIYDRSQPADEFGNYPLHRFRPIDIATIFRAVRKGETVGNNLRATALQALESITGDKIKIDIQNLQEDKYAWLQIIQGMPRQAFTHNEMLVFNLFPSTDIERNGYPTSPIENAVTSITTSISVGAYKKLYFQNGRATKGMLVIQSDEVDQAILDNMKLQFNASINNVSNSFRTPIFGIGQQDKVSWLPMTGEGLGDEFQFLLDQITRNILASFGISPDELPGFGHLSKGTNSQTLSESNSEFKLTAARDSGLRPIILKFQTFLNQRLFPLMDPLLSKVCEIRLSGLDAQSVEQENTRLQQDQPIHMTFNQTLHEVDKDPVPKMLGGDFPFSERYQLILDKYSSVGEIMSNFMGDPSAAVDPLLKFKRDPFWLQQIQLLSSISPGAVQAYYAPKPYAIDFLKMEISDMLEDDNV